jgi:flagellar protein FlaG
MNMDITNFSAKDSVAPTVVNVSGGAAAIPTTHGNSLPTLGQASVPSANAQQGTVASQPDSATLHSLVNQANHAVSAHDSNLKFTVAEGTNIRVIRIEDSETGELIRQIPSEAMVALSRALEEMRQGALLEEKA